MGKSYRPYHPDQAFLLPPSLREWLPENHLVYFVSDVVDNLNLTALDAAYGDEQRGQPPYDPRMMTKVLVYGYCVGVFSSRRIERHLVEDVGFRVLAAVGVDEHGDKQVLGLREGATENAAAVRALLADLVERGLDPNHSC